MAEKIYITYNLLYIVNNNGTRQGQSPPGCVGVGNIADRYFGYVEKDYILSRMNEYFPKVISKDTFEGLKLVGLTKMPVEYSGTGPVITERDFTEEEHRLQTLGIIEVRDWITRLRTQIDIADVVGRVMSLQKRASLFENIIVALAKEQFDGVPASTELKVELKKITDAHTTANNVCDLPVKSFMEADMNSIVTEAVNQDAMIASLEALIAATPSVQLNDIIVPPAELDHMVEP